MESGEKSDPILEQLRHLNAELSQQNSLRQRFLTGIVYGVGFILGSAILATIVIGLAAPLVANIPWVQELFLRGASLVR